MVDVRPLREEDREPWEELSRGYHAFYGRTIPPEFYARTWARISAGNELQALGAVLDGALVGIAHYFRHPRFWFEDVVYLQDLFVEERARGLGAGRALIEAVAERARAAGAGRLYWHTKAGNEPARRLYDSVAAHTGFIRYDYALSGDAT